MFLCKMNFLKGSYRNINRGQQLILLVAMMFLFGSMSFVFGAIIYDNHTSLEQTPLWILLFRQTSDSISFFILPILAYLYLTGNPIKKWVLGSQKSDVYIFFTIAIMMIASIPLVHALAAFNASIPFPESWTGAIALEAEINGIMNRMFADDSFYVRAWLFLIIAIIAPIAEELVFRGFFVRWFKNIHRSAIFSITVSAFIFSAIHMQVLGFIPRFLLGILLACLFYRSATLVYCIWAHFIYNGVSYLVEIWGSSYGLSPDFESALKGENVLVLSFSSIVLLFSILFFYKRLQKKEILPLF